VRAAASSAITVDVGARRSPAVSEVMGTLLVSVVVTLIAISGTPSFLGDNLRY